MQITVVTPPPFEPVTLADCYGHLRLDPMGSPPAHPDDAMLARHIAGARADVEKDIRRALVLQTLMIALPHLPQAYSLSGGYWGYQNIVGRPGHCYVELKRPPFQELLSVQYFDLNNALQTLNSQAYYVDSVSDIVARLIFTDAAVAMPSTFDRPDAVLVTWRAGYTPDNSPPTDQADYAAGIPEDLKNAILIGVQLRYDQLSSDDRLGLERMRAAILTGYPVHSF